MIKKILLFSLVFIFFLKVESQEIFEWDLKSLGFFNNKEFLNQYTSGATYFGQRIDFSAGIRIDSIHSLKIGADYLYEFGAYPNSIPLFPVLYYSYSDNNFDFNIGAFPREQKINYPRVLFRGIIKYYRPNIEGIYFKAKRKFGYQNVWLDWVGRQTETVNESFLGGASGEIKFGKFFFENYFYMYHFADAGIRDSLFHIRDNGGGVFLFGIDLSEKIYSKIAVGTAFSYDRYRPDPYVFKGGAYGRLNVEYSRYLLRVTQYYGESLSLAYGNKFYTSKVYTRIDAEFNLIKHKNVQLKFQFATHCFPEGYDFSQKVILRFNIQARKKVYLNNL